MFAVLLVMVQDYVRIGSRQANRVFPVFMALEEEIRESFCDQVIFKVGIHLNRN